MFPKLDISDFYWIFFHKKTLTEFPGFWIFFQDSRVGVKGIFAEPTFQDVFDKYLGSKTRRRTQNWQCRLHIYALHDGVKSSKIRTFPIVLELGPSSTNSENFFFEICFCRILGPIGWLYSGIFVNFNT